MFYERYGGRIIGDLATALLALGLISVVYDVGREWRTVEQLHSYAGLAEYAALTALACMFTAYHALAYKMDLACWENDCPEPDRAPGPSRIIFLYLIDLSALAAMAGMFGALAMHALSDPLEPHVLTIVAACAGTWHLLMVAWFLVEGSQTGGARTHLGFAGWYAVLAALPMLVAMPPAAAAVWLVGFAASLGLLYFGRFRHIVATAQRHARDRAARG